MELLIEKHEKQKMIFSDETLDNTIDEIKNAWTLMDQRKETITYRDFQAVSESFFDELQKKLAQIDILCNIVSYSRLVGPISDEICNFRVFINVEIMRLFNCFGPENLIFNCVDVSSSPSPLLPKEADLDDLNLDSQTPLLLKEDEVDQTWSILPLPPICLSIESLRLDLATHTKNLPNFYIRTRKTDKKISGGHARPTGAMRCSGRFSYKLQDGVYRLYTNIPHTCQKLDSVEPAKKRRAQI